MRTGRTGSLRHGLAEEIRRLVMHFCCALGGLAGLWLGFLAAPKHGGSAQLLPALGEVLMPVGWRVGAGVAAGALVAWTLAVAVPWLQVSGRRAS
jgi:hypothetical protein